MTLTICETDYFQEALKRFPFPAQVDMAIEECAELIVALEHYKRKRCDWKKVAEEIADVRIVTGQLALINGWEFDYFYQLKMKRLQRKLKQAAEAAPRGAIDEIQT